jgi:uncharacterized heparinase superfamily protein
MRIKYRFWHPHPRHKSEPAPTIRPQTGPWELPYERNQSLNSPNRFSFLNETHSIIKKEDWNNPELSKLWLYNLHYFDDLNSKNSRLRKEWHKQLLIRWINDNPEGRGEGWEPYPLSLRIVNWIKWAMRDHSYDYQFLDSLVLQIRYLYNRFEYHLLGNHLLANAKAMIFSGLFFDGREAETWLNKGELVLIKEIKEQILSDGGHFERSPMYHFIVLEDLLDIYNLNLSFSRSNSKILTNAINKMLDWGAIMRHPDGEIPFFNDAAIGVAPKPVGLDAYAQSLGFYINDNPVGKHLPSSGFILLQNKQVAVFADIGSVQPSYLPAHAHAGTLSFELSLHGKRIFVNSGTSCYASGPEREYQRSTLAHNTVEIDGKDSSEVWSSFRVARRAYVMEASYTLNNNKCVCVASHDGYTRLKSPVVHRRRWLLGNDELKVMDELLGKDIHRFKVIFLLNPELMVSEVSGIIYIKNIESDWIVVLYPDPCLNITLENANYYPEFGLSIPAYKIVGTSEMELPRKLEHKIQWITGGI